MKRLLVKCCALFLLSLLLFLPLTPFSLTSNAAVSFTSNDKVVAAYYFYWYNVHTGQHFFNPGGSDALTDHPPSSYLGDFSWSDVSWHKRELLDMLAAKIDVVLPVYWGSTQESFWAGPGLDNLVTASNQLIAEGKNPPKIGMFFDTTALRQQNANNPLNLANDSGNQVMYQMISDFFSRIPDSLRAKIDGHPLIYLYVASPDYVVNYNQNTFTYLNTHFQADNNNVTPYIVREQSWSNVSTWGVYTWGTALNGPVIQGTIASLGPGYNDIAAPNRDHQYRDRDCGNFYLDSWETVANSSARLVTLETWNELHEGTDIAATLEYGRTYIDLTAQNVQKWKSGASSYSTSPMVWLDFGQPLYSHGLYPAFNYYDGAWKIRFLGGRQAAYPDHSTNPASNHIYLSVNDDFYFAKLNGQFWITVEYYDEGTDLWWLEYDSNLDPYKKTEMVALTNTHQWLQHTFYITDAYFGSRQQQTLADLRLVDGYDGQTNYFGRVWISKSAPSGQPPDLTLKQAVVYALAGRMTDIPLKALSPNSLPLTLTLDRGPGFASLIDNGNGNGVLHLAPTTANLNSCTYMIRVIASDNRTIPLSDAAPLQVKVVKYGIFIPLVISAPARQPP